MATLPNVTYYWRPSGAADDAWTEAPAGAFVPTPGAEVEVVGVGPSRARRIVADTLPAAGTLDDQTMQVSTAGAIAAGGAFTGTNLTFSLLDAPDWATIDAATGEIAWSAPAVEGPAGTWRVRAANSAGAAEASFAAAVVASPVFVEWSPIGDVFPVRALYAPSSGAFATDYDPAAYEYAGPNVVHVDAAAGDDAIGDGSAGAPWATIGKAIAEAVGETRIEIAEGRYLEALGAVTGKDLTLVGAGTVIVGDFWWESELSWADASDVAPGLWKATPPSGSVGGLLDLETLTMGFPTVSLKRSGAAECTAAMDYGRAALWRGSTYSYVGTPDRRDLSGTADTGVVVLKTGSVDFALVDSRVFARGIIFAGSRVVADATSRFVGHDCVVSCSGGTDHTDFGGAETILYRCAIGGNSGDACDYEDGVGVEIECLIGGCGGGAGDNASTAHSTARVLSVNCRFEGASRTVNDIGPSIRVLGGCTIGGAQIDDRYSATIGLPGLSNPTTMHLAGMSFVPGAAADLFIGDGGQAVVYDDPSAWTILTEGSGAWSTGTLPA